MAEQVTTTIVAVQYPATSCHVATTGISFLWMGVLRTLWFRNYEDQYPDGNKARKIRAAVGTYAKSKATAEIRVEVFKPVIPRLRIFVTRGQDGKCCSFHIEKASGRPFDHGQIVIENRIG